MPLTQRLELVGWAPASGLAWRRSAPPAAPRIASTAPSRCLGVPSASPASAARAVSKAAPLHPRPSAPGYW